MADNNTAILNQLPSRLKKARKDRGLSLEAVTNLSGVSKSMLSQIERGESSPTIATLWNLTRALQVDFAGLLDDPEPCNDMSVLRADDVPTINARGRGCSISILSPPENVGKHEVYELRFTPGGELNSQPHGLGTREHVTVTEGTVHITSNDQTETLCAGDTVRYAADVPHCIKAKDSARVYLIVIGV